MFRCQLAPRQKKVPASLTWWHFSEVLIFFALWFSADSWTLKLNSDKFDQWRIRRRMWRNIPAQKIVLTQSYDANILPAVSYLDAGRRIKDSGRPVDIYIYIYIYIYRDRKPSQHVTVGLAWGSPQSSAACDFIMHAQALRAAAVVGPGTWSIYVALVKKWRLAENACFKLDVDRRVLVPSTLVVPRAFWSGCEHTSDHVGNDNWKRKLLAPLHAWSITSVKVWRTSFPLHLWAIWAVFTL